MLTKEVIRSRIAQYEQMRDAFAGAAEKATRSALEADAAIRELQALLAMMHDEEAKPDGDTG